MKKNAFSLLELMIYLGLGLLFSTILFSCFTTFQIYFTQQTIFYDKTIRTLLALDLVKRDLMSASTRAEDWSPSGIFAKETLNQKNNEQTLSVYWSIKKNRLQRIEGAYNHVQKKWSKKKTSFLGGFVSNFSLTPVTDTQDSTRIIGVTLRYQLRTNRASHLDDETYIQLRSRVMS
jgi:type II secretory pathway component PulJ